MFPHSWQRRRLRSGRFGLAAPLEELLFRQRQRSYVGREGSWVFPNSKGGHLHYRNWLERGWPQALERARVKPREGDAQKALRRSYITSALICGRNPKLVASEVGHTTARMVLETYDSSRRRVDPRDRQDVIILREILHRR